MKVPTFLEIINLYAPHLEGNIYYRPEKDFIIDGPGRYFSTLAVAYAIMAPRKEGLGQRDEDLARRAIEILAEGGVDFTKKDPGQFNKSALEIAAEHRYSGVYDLILKVSLNYESSATEAVAFENKFTDALKKIKKGIVKGAKATGRFIINDTEVKDKNGVIRLKREGHFGNVAVRDENGNIVFDENGNIVKKRMSNLQQARQVQKAKAAKGRFRNQLDSDYLDPNNDRGKIQKYHVNNGNDKKAAVASPEWLDERWKTLNPADKKRFLLTACPGGVAGPLGNSWPALAENLMGEAKPFSSPLYQTASNLAKANIKVSPDVAGVLADQRFSPTLDVINEKGMGGFTTKDFTTQLKTITFYKYQGWNIDDLRKGSNWMTADEMKAVVNQRDGGGEIKPLSERGKGGNNSSSPKTPSDQEMKKALNKFLNGHENELSGQDLVDAYTLFILRKG